MGAVPGWLLRHRVRIEPYIGDSAYGPLYGAELTVRAMVDDTTRIVRSPTGAEVTSSTTVYVRRGVACPPGSRVTLPSGRRTVAISTADRNGGGLPTPDHQEVSLE
ncbi:hypothetical protein [Streptomyces sp. SID3343]|uniref:hypothetical protein n=1 Tax=Streptomyces sp. SID3343 TaxID=2690260 RepID=UPI00136E4116|nr:hypothetical protein [Streptomyces sp. SID3343]MYW03465.1 hypothetical protein [Streptomyces sp. SID3343]